MATDINCVVLVGRLTRDAELTYTSSGAPICKFSIANNYSRKQGEEWVEETSFFDAVMFGRRTEALQRYLVKGKQIAIQGEIRQDRWETDGQKRSKVVVYVNDVNLLGGGQGSRAPEGEAGQSGRSSAGRAPGRSHGGAADTSQPAADDGYGSGGEFEDDVPF